MNISIFRRLLVIFSLLLSLVCHSQGAPEIDSTSRLEQAIALHNAALEGEDDDAAEKAKKLLLKMIKQEPENSLAAVYLGSTYTLMARDSDMVVNKVRYSNRGIRYLDLALEISPDDFLVRYIRSRVNSSLPDMFHRSKKATEDMLALDTIYQKNMSKDYASLMVGIYENLMKSAPSKGDWKAKMLEAKNVSGE